MNERRPRARTPQGLAVCALVSALAACVPHADGTATAPDASNAGSGVAADAGAVASDAGAAVDSGAIGADSGSAADAAVGADSGSTEGDAGEAADAGTGAPDAGTGAPDAGTGAPDAGTGAPDAGTGAPDAGLGAPDAGLGAPDAGGRSPSLVDPASVVATLVADTTVGAAAQVLASSTLSLSTPRPVLFHAAGNWFTANGVSIGRMQIRVDGAPLPGNTSMLFNLPGQRHPFLVIGAETLPAGAHTVELVASRDAGSGELTVQATAEVTALVGFGDVARVETSASGSIADITPVEIASMRLSTAGPVFLEHAGTILRTGGAGDAITKIYGDGAWVADSMFGINDMVPGHDDIAPLGAQALWDPGVGTHAFALDAHKLDYAYNTVTFDVVPGAMLLAAWGNIAGAASRTIADAPVGNDERAVADMSFSLPPGHDGRVWIAAEGRWLDLLNTGTGGLESARLVLDGALVGPWAVQAFEAQMTQSQRNFALAHLASGLAPGPHTVQIRLAKANPADPLHDMPNFSVSARLDVLW